ncbi:MAG: hypothetical protein L0H83_02655, partial [Salinisphaera sp.]|nr:hypothetical protein [Salinisphaera sp.]
SSKRIMKSTQRPRLAVIGARRARAATTRATKPAARAIAIAAVAAAAAAVAGVTEARTTLRAHRPQA